MAVKEVKKVDKENSYSRQVEITTAIECFILALNLLELGSKETTIKHLELLIDKNRAALDRFPLAYDWKSQSLVPKSWMEKKK